MYKGKENEALQYFQLLQPTNPEVSDFILSVYKVSDSDFTGAIDDVEKLLKQERNEIWRLVLPACKLL